MTSLTDGSGASTITARYIGRETAISSAINAAISAGFFLAVFGFGAAIEVWGLGNYAFDFLPQSFAVAFFGCFVPSLLTRRALLAGKVLSATGTVPTKSGLFVKSVLSGAIAVIVGGGLWLAGLWVSGAASIEPVPAFTLKIVYGAALGALVTRIQLKAMLN